MSMPFRSKKPGATGSPGAGPSQNRPPPRQLPDIMGLRAQIQANFDLLCIGDKGRRHIVVMTGPGIYPPGYQARVFVEHGNFCQRPEVVNQVLRTESLGTIAEALEVLLASTTGMLFIKYNDEMIKFRTHEGEGHLSGYVTDSGTNMVKGWDVDEWDALDQAAPQDD